MLEFSWSPFRLMTGSHTLPVHGHYPLSGITRPHSQKQLGLGVVFRQLVFFSWFRCIFTAVQAVLPDV